MSKLIRALRPYIRLLGLEKNGGDYQVIETDGVLRLQINNGTDTEPEWNTIIEINNDEVVFFRPTNIDGGATEQSGLAELEEFILLTVSNQAAKGALTVVNAGTPGTRINGKVDVIPVFPVRTDIKEGTPLYIPSVYGKTVHVITTGDIFAGDEQIPIIESTVDIYHGDPVLIDDVLRQAMLLIQPDKIQQSVEAERLQTGFTHITATIQEGNVSTLYVEPTPVSIDAQTLLDVIERRTGKTIRVQTTAAVAAGSVTIPIQTIFFNDIFEIGSKVELASFHLKSEINMLAGQIELLAGGEFGETESMASILLKSTYDEASISLQTAFRVAGHETTAFSQLTQNINPGNNQTVIHANVPADIIKGTKILVTSIIENPAEVVYYRSNLLPLANGTYTSLPIPAPALLPNNTRIRLSFVSVENSSEFRGRQQTVYTTAQVAQGTNPIPVSQFTVNFTHEIVRVRIELSKGYEIIENQITLEADDLIEKGATSIPVKSFNTTATFPVGSSVEIPITSILESIAAIDLTAGEGEAALVLKAEVTDGVITHLAFVALSANANTGSDIQIGADKIRISGETTFAPGYNPSVKTFSMRSGTQPTQRPDGTSLQVGDIWFDTSNGDLPYSWNGSSFIRSYTKIDGGDIVTGTVNTQRLNVNEIISTGSILVTGANVSELTNDAGYVTSADVGEQVATDAQNAIAVQLGYIDYAHMVSTAQLEGTTLIIGGYLNTEVIDAKAITSTMIDVVELFSQEITIGSGGFIVSNNFVQYTTGWKISENGYELNNGIITGGTIQTAATGARVRMTSSVTGGIQFLLNDTLRAGFSLEENTDLQMFTILGSISLLSNNAMWLTSINSKIFMAGDNLDLTNVRTLKQTGVMYTGTTNPSNTQRLNYDGNFHATKLAEGGILIENRYSVHYIGTYSGTPPGNLGKDGDTAFDADFMNGYIKFNTQWVQVT